VVVAAAAEVVVGGTAALHRAKTVTVDTDCENLQDEMVFSLTQ